MSSISAVSDSFKNILSKGGIVDLKSPADDVNENTSLFLYHIVPDEFGRNISRPVANEGDGGPRKVGLVPLSVNLQYLITPLKKDVTANNDEASRLLLAIHENPIVIVRDIAQGINDKMRVSFACESIEDRFRIWDSFKNKPYRLSFAVMLRSAKILSLQTTDEVSVASIGSTPFQTLGVG